MMRKSLCLLLTLAAIVVIAAVSGCTLPGSGTATPTQSPQQHYVLSKGASLFDQSKFHLFEYKILASDGNVTITVGDIKSEYDNVSYGGVSGARHLKQTAVNGQGSQAVTTVTDLYYNPTTNMLLGGHTRATTASGTKESDIAASDTAYWNADMASINPNVEFIDEGTELVQVPKGSYYATKFTNTDSGITLWMTNGVPVPVKISGASTSNGVKVITIMELVNYS